MNEGRSSITAALDLRPSSEVGPVAANAADCDDKL